MLSNKKIICPNNLINVAKKTGTVDAVIVNAGEIFPMESVHKAVQHNLINPTFIGNETEIKKYAKNTGRMAGKKIHAFNVVKTAFEIIYQKTGKNPVEILVRAVENSAPNEDTTRIVYGGTVYHVSVDVPPIRRVDLALRFIADGVKESTFSNPKAIEEYLAEHLILSANNDPAAPSVKRKNELERIAQASR